MVSNGLGGSSRGGPLRFQGVKIFFVDDSKLPLAVIGKYLTALGAEYLGVNDSMTALARAAKFSPDVIITDYEMPGKNGLTLIEEFRADSRFDGVPIVLLTASDDVQICISAIEIGADDFVNKDQFSKMLVPKITALVRIRNNNLKIIQLKELQIVEVLVATYKHEFNNTLTILEGRIAKIKGSLRSDADLGPLRDIADCIQRMKSFLQALNEVKVVKTEQYIGKTKILKLKS